MKKKKNLDNHFVSCLQMHMDFLVGENVVLESNINGSIMLDEFRRLTDRLNKNDMTIDLLKVAIQIQRSIQ